MASCAFSGDSTKLTPGSIPTSGSMPKALTDLDIYLKTVYGITTCAGRCAEDTKLIEVVDSKREATLDLKLLERGKGIFHRVPVMAGEQYLGTIYAIQLKAEAVN